MRLRWTNVGSSGDCARRMRERALVVCCGGVEWSGLTVNSSSTQPRGRTGHNHRSGWGLCWLCDLRCWIVSVFVCSLNALMLTFCLSSIGGRVPPNGRSGSAVRGISSALNCSSGSSERGMVNGCRDTRAAPAEVRNCRWYSEASAQDTEQRRGEEQNRRGQIENDRE